MSREGFSSKGAETVVAVLRLCAGVLTGDLAERSLQMSIVRTVYCADDKTQNETVFARFAHHPTLIRFGRSSLHCCSGSIV